VPYVRISESLIGRWSTKDIVSCRVCAWLLRRVLVWMIGFIDYRKWYRYRHSTHFIFHLAHALEFSVFTSRILATDLSRSHCNFRSHDVFLVQSTFFSCQFQRLHPILFWLRFNTPTSAIIETRLYYPLCTDPTENSASIVDKACLPRRCLAIDVLLFRARVLRKCVCRRVA
jgi:hypothetical protein